MSAINMLGIVKAIQLVAVDPQTATGSPVTTLAPGAARAAKSVAEGGDPLLSGGLFWAPLIIVLIKVVLAFVVLLVGVMLMVWFERKKISDMQNRIGPNRAGPFGLLQTLADGTKLFFKEDLFPERADKVVFRLAPYLSAVPAFLTISVIPLGGKVSFFNNAKWTTYLQVASPPMGVLFSLAISSIAVYGVMLAGWSSGSKYPLIGSVRASAQMVSYEAAMGLALTAVILVSGTLSTQGIVNAQAGYKWNIFTTGLIPFVVFAIAGTAELNRPPFDLVEAESELVGGFHTEYSSARFAFFFLAEFMNMITMSALIITLFLGGPRVPWNVPFFSAVSPVWFLLKLYLLLYGYILLRATLPRFRYDQLMDLGWKRLIPVALLWLMVIAAFRTGTGAERFRNGLITLVGAAIAGGLLLAAMRVGRRTSELERSAGKPALDSRGRAGRF
jgi:NADH-quinone oxidoreductase subunit H